MLGAARRAAGAAHAALTAALVALMLASLPMGAHVLLGGGPGPQGPLEWAGMAALWASYAAMVGVALLGPRAGAGAWAWANPMATAAGWFAVLVAASWAIEAAQSSQGIEIVPPEYGSDAERLADATRAPLVEELAFRVLLVGAPLAALCARHAPPARALRALLHPHARLDGRGGRAAAALILASAALFGALHIVGDGSWSAGKATQAGVAGAILGWVYYRHGLLVAVLVHWATNYFVLSFLHFVAGAAGVGLAGVSSHPAGAAFEALLVASGAVAAAALALGHRHA